MRLPPKVDFFSVGTNDLTQYMLAVDRNNPRVASLYDTLNPGMLHALQHIIQRCTELRKPVSVCGEMAGDPGWSNSISGDGLSFIVDEYAQP